MLHSTSVDIWQYPNWRRLVVVITNTDATLVGQAVGPPATELDVGLGHTAVAQEQPQAKDGLGQDIEDAVSQDLAVHGGLARTIGETPNTVHDCQKDVTNWLLGKCCLHGVGGPEDEGEQGQGAKQLGDLVALGLDGVAAGQGDVPDDKDVGDARDGVPAPLLAALLGSVGGKQTGQDHDEIGADGHDGVGTVDAGEQAEVEQQERGGDGPVDVAGVVCLTADLVDGVGNLAVAVLHGGAVQVDAVAVGHAEVGQRGGDGDHGGDIVVETLRDGDVPGEEGEEARSHDHDDEDDP